MSIQSRDAASQAASIVFFEQPLNLQVDVTASSSYMTAKSIETLIQTLQQTNGPLAAVGKIGPNHYRRPPTALEDKVYPCSVYGWSTDTAKKENADQSKVLVLGARKSDEGAFVYFTLSEDTTRDPTAVIRTHKSFNRDFNMYIAPYSVFEEGVSSVYPCASSTPEYTYAQKLSTLGLSSMSKTEGAAACKSIGLEAFKRFNEEAQGNVQLAAKRLEKILYFVEQLASRHLAHRNFVAKAWNGIGAQSWN